MNPVIAAEGCEIIGPGRNRKENLFLQKLIYRVNLRANLYVSCHLLVLRNVSLLMNSSATSSLIMERYNPNLESLPLMGDSS